MTRYSVYVLMIISALLGNSCTNDTADSVNTNTPDTLARDTVPPVITILGGDTVTIEYEDPNDKVGRYADISNTSLITATDPYPEGGTVTLYADRSSVNVFSPISSNEVFFITYTAVDEANNMTVAKRYIRIIYPVELQVQLFPGKEAAGPVPTLAGFNRPID